MEWHVGRARLPVVIFACTGPLGWRWFSFSCQHLQAGRPATAAATADLQRDALGVKHGLFLTLKG